MLSIGIDFGTSNSSVAVYDTTRGALRLLPLDARGRSAEVMRSLLYITREGEIVAGQHALDLYTEQNTGREVKLERVFIRDIKMMFAEVGEVVEHGYALIDVNEPGRLFQSLKRFLSMTSFKQTDVFGRQYTLEELVALLARHMVDAAEATLGEPIDELIVGRPVRFSEDADTDTTARERLEIAWDLVGLKRVRFLEEPVAAAHHYAADARIAPGAHLLVFDFGGGTLDVTVAREAGGRAQVLETGGVPIGGDLLDSRIMETRMAPVLGRGARYQPDDLPVPNRLFARLRSWQTIVELNRPDLLELIREAARTSDRPEALAALEEIVTHNLGQALFRAIEDAKIALSDADAATVRLHRGLVDLDREITRLEFEAAIGEQLRAARALVPDVVERAGCEPEQIDIVITTGGSSLIPAFRALLQDALPRAQLAETDTFTSVAAGLALAGAGDGR